MITIATMYARSAVESETSSTLLAIGMSSSNSTAATRDLDADRRQVGGRPPPEIAPLERPADLRRLDPTAQRCSTYQHHTNDGPYPMTTESATASGPSSIDISDASERPTKSEADENHEGSDGGRHRQCLMRWLGLEHVTSNTAIGGAQARPSK